MKIGITSALFLILLVLKLTHVIDWSWWWITAPLWLGWSLILLFIVLGGVFMTWFSKRF